MCVLEASLLDLAISVLSDSGFTQLLAPVPQPMGAWLNHLLMGAWVYTQA